MRIQIQSPFGDMFQIDSLDPELLGKWLAEIFTRMGPIHEVMWPRVQVWPSITPDGKLDWIADSRVLGKMYPVISPEDAILAMRTAIREYEELHAKDSQTQVGGSQPG